jgi:hypothetical protein
MPPLVPPQNTSFSPLPLVPPSPETAARGIPPGEGVASEQHAVDPRLEVLKPPDSNEEPLEEPRGVCLCGTEPACVASNADAGTTIERTGVGAYEPGGVPLGAIAAPAYTEGAAGIELIGVAEKAAAAEPEALEPWAKSGRPRGRETPPPIEGELETPTPPSRGLGRAWDAAAICPDGGYAQARLTAERVPL